VRKVFFWIHLIAGTLAGIVILIMSVTGVLLMYERQMIEWADRAYRSSPPSSESSRRPAESLLQAARDYQQTFPATLTLQSDPGAPAEAAFGRESIVYIDVYSGRVLGEGSAGIRSFFRVVTDWHRWLAMKDAGRATGKAITGVCNLLFLFLALSGMYLWLPRRWTWPNARAVLFFRGSLSGKARDFNWHNVIGIWSAVPLVFVILGALVISFPWATNLVYILTGSEFPAAASSPRPAAPAKPATTTELNLSGLDIAWARAEQQVAGWQSIILRVPASNRAPYMFTIAESHRGRPDKRASLTLHRQTAEIMQFENFASFNTGRRVRSWLRFIHTGEALGVAGQTIAGLVSAGGAVLVWTGLALAWRRFRSWRARKRTTKEDLVSVSS
jgi:uncharacterized iron-regulated membrane protein